VPAPTSTSNGCCSTHPRAAQKLCKRNNSSWNVSAAGLAADTAVAV